MFKKIYYISITSLMVLASISAQAIEVFNNGDFKGDSNQYTEGDYDKLRKLNDKISSIRISEGLQIVIYEHGSFKGKSIVLTSDVKSLNNYNFNDKISSIKVQPYEKKSDAVTAYEHGDFKGKILPLTANEYNNLGKLTWMNDNISSIRISSDCQVIAFEHGDYKGKKIIITSDQPNMNDLKFNDKISSIIVECGQDKGSYALNSKGDSKDKFIANKGEKKIIASGFGVNSDQALQKALRNAVEEAVGSYISSNTLIENDDLIEDKILSLSRGFIKDFRTLSTEKIEGEIKLTVAAIVTGDQVIETLKSSGVEVEIKGNLLFSQFSDLNRQIDDEAKLVESLFSEVPANSPFDFIVSNDTPVQLEGQSGFKVQLSVKAVVNKNYTILMQNIKNILDGIALDVVDVKINKKTFQFINEEKIPSIAQKKQKKTSIDDAMLNRYKEMQGGNRVIESLKGWHAAGTLGCTEEYSKYSKSGCKPPYIMPLVHSTASASRNDITGLALHIDKDKDKLFKLKPITDSEWDSFRNLYSNYFNSSNTIKRLETAEGNVYADIFEKGRSPYHIGIMLSDDTVRMYRLIGSKSFEIIQKYFDSYLYNVKFDILQLFTKKIEDIAPKTIEEGSDVEKRLTRQQREERGSSPPRINNDIADLQDNKTKTTFLLELRDYQYSGNISISSSINTSGLIKYKFPRYKGYGKGGSTAAYGPSRYHSIPPMINRDFIITYYYTTGKGQYGNVQKTAELFQGKIHMLAAIPENGSYFTIDNIQMWISPEAFSSLSSIKIE